MFKTEQENSEYIRNDHINKDMYLKAATRSRIHL